MNEQTVANAYIPVIFLYIFQFFMVPGIRNVETINRNKKLHEPRNFDSSIIWVLQNI